MLWLSSALGRSFLPWAFEKKMTFHIPAAWALMLAAAKNGPLAADGGRRLRVYSSNDLVSFQTSPVCGCSFLLREIV